MRISATFSDGLQRQLDGRAIGDEFAITAQARIVGADEVLLDVSGMDDSDRILLQGDLEVRLLLSHGKVSS